jgi:small-conductance mechanosensitive channel
VTPLPPSFAPLFSDYPAWFAATSAIVVTGVLAYLVAELVSRVACRAIRSTLGSADDEHGRLAVARAGRLVRVVVFALLALILIFPALELVGFTTSVGLQPQTIGEWLFKSGLRVGVVLLVSFLVLRITSTVTARFERQIEASSGIDALERLRRARTLGTLIRNTVNTLVSVIALLMILRELNLDITPILTGAGIVGLAVGFGAQSLVKDIISGFFLILENQVRVGDVAAINGTGGQVEAISLRTIVLRDGDGTVHVFPNGSITTLSNRSKDFSFYGIDLNVAFDEEPDRIVALIKEVGATLEQDPALAPAILAPVEVFGVDNFTDVQMTVKFRIKTLPLKQWDVGREFRRRLVKRFHEEGIRLPRQQTMVIVESGAKGPLQPKSDATGQPS